MITIPNEKKWRITNNGDVFGNLYTGTNIEFDQQGYLTQTGRPIAIYTSDDDSNFDTVQAINYYGSNYFVVTSDGIFTLTLNTLTVSQNSASGVPTTGNESDSVVWQQRAYVTSTNNLHYWDGASWTGSLLSLTASRPHPIAVLETKNQLAVGNANTVTLLTSAHTTSATLTIPSEFYVTSIRAKDNNLFIGTKHIYGGQAKIFVWNGVGTTAQAAYTVNSDWVFSLANYASTIVAITNNGEILQYNGGFVHLAGLPVFYTTGVWQGTNGNALIGKVCNRGMIADGDLLYINIDGDVNDGDNYLRNQPSGVWCYDPSVGLYNRSISTSDKIASISISAVDTATDIVTLGTATKATTGEPVYITNSGNITGISAAETYYVIRVTSTTIKFARTPADAYEGSAINLGGTVGSPTIKIAAYNYVGELADTTQGAIGLVTSQDSPETMWSTNIIWGARVNSKDALCVLSSASNVSTIVTPRVFSPNVTDNFPKVYIEFDNLNLDGDAIVVKYKDRDRFGLPNSWFDTADWYDNESFNVAATDASFNQVEEGDEVVLVTGDGAGYTTHITSITSASSPFAYETDVVPNIVIADQSNVYMDSFKKAGTITNATTTYKEGYAEIPITSKSQYITIKLELRGHIRIRGIKIVSSSFKDNR